MITIGRQFGAGGESVAQLVARQLGADVLDRQLVGEVARRLEIPDEEVESQDEAPGSLLSRLLTALGSSTVEFSAPPEVAAWAPPYADPAFDPRHAILTITQQVIREAARGGNAVIVGHGGAYLLREHPGVLHVFLMAPEAARVKAVAQMFGVEEAEARKQLKQKDANRSAYVKQVYGHSWLDPSHYHLVIDSDHFGFEGAADLIVAAVRSK